MSKKPIQYLNRATRQLETEQIYGEEFVRWLYKNPAGALLADLVLSSPWFSKLYGRYQSSPQSARKIRDFIETYKLKMDEYEDTEHYSSFNEFFIRKFKPQARRFTENPSELPAFAEGRYFAFESVGERQVFPIKGKALSPDALLGSTEKAKPFIGGPAMIARLCPTDYHRFHFPDDGRTLERYALHGRLHSVNPIALRRKKEVFIKNERQISILETKNFGRLAYIEVGALCVGKIVQSHPIDRPFHRGDEKGYFLFGGSTVILLGEPQRWKPDVDLLAQTTQGIESFVHLGERIASAST